ncbi:hypothetical protein PJM27_19510 [Mycobacterium kansasii]
MGLGSLPRIWVYCEGSVDKAHERFDFAPYVRHVVEPSGRPMWLPGIDFDESGRVNRRRQTHTAKKLRWNCPRCSLDEQRKSDPWVIKRVNDALERVYADGGAEISARALIADCWPKG